MEKRQNWSLYVFFQYLIRAELFSDHEKLDCPREHWTLPIDALKVHVNEETTEKL